jgi:Polymer-forming cytoskeletal
MLRSLLNSARGRSAVIGSGPTSASLLSNDYILPPETPLSSAPAPAPSASVTTLRPERCCVYCGHPLYAPPRLPRIRCPRCFQELPVRDIQLCGDVREEQIITSSKIIVFPEARVAASLIGCTVEVSGHVLGNILASQTCRIRATGKVAGQILCRYLELEPGAQLEAQVELIRD